jgi:lipopolysaccharide/colanic/teichoic acid biosynthesis glycosyltransferase
MDQSTARESAAASGASVPPHAVEERGGYAGKRLFDVLLAVFLLIVLAGPMLLVMLVLRFTGEGQVFFLQERIGWGGRRFKVIKFATMRTNSENLGTKDITVWHDPRVLPVGRVLRKAKINELPQLLNVLKGDMSFVGWRPLLAKGFSYYPPHVQERIIHMKPGLTGVGSIIFRDEESITARAEKPPERVYQEDIAPYKGELELWYQRNQSFWLDVKVVLVTAWVLFNPRSRLPELLLRGMPPLPAFLR